MFFYNFIKKGKILAICDTSLKGKKFEENDLVLDIKEEFYCKEKGEKEKILRLIKKAKIINAVGNEIVGILKENEIIDEDKILKVQGVQHAQLFKIS